MKNIGVIIPAGGVGKRMKSNIPKQYIELAGKPILVHVLEAMDKIKEIKQIVVAGDLEILKSVFKNTKNLTKNINIVKAGEKRQDSVNNAFQLMGDDIEYVLIHDAVRPLVTVENIKKVIVSASENDSAVLGVPVKSTIKKVDKDNFVIETPKRDELWEIQTPQVFKKDILESAYNAVWEDDVCSIHYTDEAMMVELDGYKVKIVEGDYENIKITTPEDLKIAEVIYENRNRI
jgi:2-C-methyl-D-erythritol 4-phosphate cytidylyltransferase